jgi:hypothetical protein
MPWLAWETMPNISALGGDQKSLTPLEGEGGLVAVIQD